MWNYIFYIAYITNKDKTDLTGIESFVKECIDHKNVEWFPIHKYQFSQLMIVSSELEESNT